VSNSTATLEDTQDRSQSSNKPIYT